MGSVRPASYSDVSSLLWLAFPPLVLFAQFGAKFVGEDFYLRTMDSELGLVEGLTVVFLLLASCLALVTVWRRSAFPVRLLKPWLYLFAVGAFLFAGEEASWGQHYFRWQTPEAWTEFNPRGETSIHNASPWFDNIPRLVLTAAAILAGILAPLWFRKRDRAGRKRGALVYWLLPTFVCLPTCVLALVVTLPKKVFERYLDTDVPRVLAISPGETKEYFFALFFLIYIASLRHRLKRWDATR